VSLQDEIFDWVRRLPPWKQELYLRAAVSPQISEQDIREVTSMLLGESMNTPAPRAVSREDLPGAHGGSEPMCIQALSDIRGVNLLAAGQMLAFEPTGLNIVYGKNGAGKTGYARIVKHAGRTLRRETVLANIAEPGSPPPSATITVAIGDSVHQLPLDLEASPPALLARICVADSLAGEEYLTSDTEVDYAPAVLTSLSRLAKALKAVGEELSKRLDDTRPHPLDLRPFGEGTEVSRTLASLSESTSEDAITKLAVLSNQERERLQQLRRKRGEIDAMQAPKLRKAAERSAATASELVSDLRTLAAALGPHGVEQARARHATLLKAQEAARLAAASLAGEPITGVGSDAWRQLWEAARAFAEHQGQGLPPTHEPASCPLCMQELAPEARARLVRFDDFVKAEISVQVRDAEQSITVAREALPDVDTVRVRHAEVLSLLTDDPQTVGDEVGRWLASAQTVAGTLRDRALEDLEPVEAPPLQSIEIWAAARRREAAGHAALEDVQERQKLQASLAELEAREELQRRRPEVLAHLAALREVERLTGAMRKLGTTRLSTTMTALSRELIEADLQGALNRHLRALDFRGLAVAVKPKTVKGKSMVALRFKTVADVPLNSVLSQGEQRRLALAMFFAEMEVLGEANPIVLDDPVCSVDQEGRRHIARTLCELSRTRQVIVFTHELSFVHELRRHAHGSLPVQFQHVCRVGQSVGHVRDGLPWEGQKASQRRQALQERLGEARAHYEAGELDEYRRDVTDFCWMLRSSFERAVEEELLGETITRRDDTVHTKNLRKIVLDEEMCELVDRGVDDCSPWAHDQPLADGADSPTPDELGAGLAVYGQLLDKAKEARRKRKLTDAPRLQALEPTDNVIAARGRSLAAVPDEPSAGESRRPA